MSYIPGEKYYNVGSIIYYVEDKLILRGMIEKFKLTYDWAEYSIRPCFFESNTVNYNRSLQQIKHPHVFKDKESALKQSKRELQELIDHIDSLLNTNT